MVQTSEGRRWLDRAAAGIRSRPDREAVRAELEAHLGDKTADLVRIFPDLGRQEAELPDSCYHEVCVLAWPGACFPTKRDLERLRRCMARRKIPRRRNRGCGPCLRCLLIRS